MTEKPIDRTARCAGCGTPLRLTWNKPLRWTCNTEKCPGYLERPKDAAERLAQGFIEATTEYDFSELPASLQAALVAVATEFIRFAQPRVVVGDVVTRGGMELRS